VFGKCIFLFNNLLYAFALKKRAFMHQRSKRIRGIMRNGVKRKSKRKEDKRIGRPEHIMTGHRPVRKKQ